MQTHGGGKEHQWSGRRRRMDILAKVKNEVSQSDSSEKNAAFTPEQGWISRTTNARVRK